jgi:hypothetical protein
MTTSYMGFSKMRRWTSGILLSNPLGLVMNWRRRRRRRNRKMRRR